MRAAGLLLMLVATIGCGFVAWDVNDQLSAADPATNVLQWRRTAEGWEQVLMTGEADAPKFAQPAETIQRRAIPEIHPALLAAMMALVSGLLLAAFSERQ